MTRLLYLLPVLLLFISCKEEKKTGECQRAFYYWKTSLDDFRWEDSTYNKLNIQKVYVRFFDVDWSEADSMAVPVAALDTYYGAHIGKVEMIPVVYITNETFKHMNTEQSQLLARQIYKRIMAKLIQYRFGDYYWDGTGWWEQNPYNLKSEKFDEIQRKDSSYQAFINSVKEIQFDCDWTESTRNSYFAFLNEMNKLFPQKTVSSTLRLYQYKYPDKAGVPPVKRAMLMCYNAGAITQASTVNSIFNKKEIMSYLEDVKKYPLTLDYAFPVFKWAVVFRGNKFVRIISTEILEENKESISKDSTAKEKNWLTVKEDFNAGSDYNSILIRKGDRIRIEEPDWDELYDIAEYISDQKHDKAVTVSLFELNNENIRSAHEKINKLYTLF